MFKYIRYVRTPHMYVAYSSMLSWRHSKHFLLKEENDGNKGNLHAQGQATFHVYFPLSIVLHCCPLAPSVSRCTCMYVCMYVCSFSMHYQVYIYTNQQLILEVVRTLH